MTSIRRWLLSTVTLLALLLALLLPPGVTAASPLLNVDVGIHVGNVYRFSASSKTYSIEGVLRLSIPAAAMPALEARGIDLIELVRFENQVEPWNSLTEPDGGLITVGGKVRRDYRFTGDFYSDQIDFRGFPFGTLPLNLLVAPVPSANGAIHAYPYDSNSPVATDQPLNLRISADPRASSVSRSSNMDGYQLRQWRLLQRGDGVLMELRYDPIGWAALVKWLLPLAITMVVMLLTPNLLATFTNERIAIPPLILLTLVFMQQAYRDSLPSLPYLTVLDTLYAFSYVVTLAFFCEFIWRANRLGRQRTAGQPSSASATAAMERLEWSMQLLSLGGYVGLVVWALSIK